MHRPEAVQEVLALRAAGLGARRIAARTGLPVSTVRDWLAGKLPRSARQTGPSCPRCGSVHELTDLSDSYLYLLGLYLGDGCISEHRREVHKLRLTLDVKYPGIAAAAEDAMRDVIPASRVARVRRKSNCFEVYSYSRSWPCLLPQHGPGVKHERRIWLAPWQQQLAERSPEPLLRGLVHSDGCRSVNTGRSGWSAPRYAFANKSTDITGIFCTACDRLDLNWSASFPGDENRAVNIYVSRKADVARMDEFIGPKG